MVSRPATASRRRGTGEAGFMLIEVMVSAVLLVVLSLATLKLIDTSQAASTQQRSKSVASNLAHNDLNRMRQMKFATASNFTTVATPKPIDGVTYTVTSTGTWTSSGGSFASCTTSPTGSAGQYLRVSSTVTWPAMGTVSPVTAETLIVPRPGEVDMTTGNFSMKVQTAAGLPVSGVTVVMNGVSLVTSTAGCVLFTGVPPGTYTATYAKSGYVATTGAATGTYSAVVTKGNTSSKTVSYDLPAYISPVTFYRDSGTVPTTTASSWRTYSVSSNLGVDFLGTYPGTPGAWSVSSMPTSFTNTTTKLFPFPAGYQVYAGSCAGNNPALWRTNYSSVFPLGSVAPTATQTVAASSYLRAMSVTVTGVIKTKTVSVYFLPNTLTTAMAGCTEKAGPMTFSNPSNNTPQTGTLSDEIPYGVYSYCVDDGSKYVMKKTVAQAYNNTPVGSTGAPPTTTTPSVAYSELTTTGTCSGLTG